MTPHAIKAGDVVALNLVFLMHLQLVQRARVEIRIGTVSSIHCEHRAVVDWDDGRDEFSVIDVDNLYKVTMPR